MQARSFSRSTAAVVTSVLVSALAFTSSASATVPASVPSVAPAQTSVDPGVVAERYLLQRLSWYDARWPVRSAARRALLRRHPDAIAQFWSSDHPYALKLSQRLATRNADFARRMLALHTEAHSPHVHAAARRAVYGGTLAQAQFARTGFAQAKEQDRLAREANRSYEQTLTQADRDVVKALAADAPGVQVRASAAHAVRPGASDADLVEFFAHDWAVAAALDADLHLQAWSDKNAVWRVQLRQLVRDAQAAEQAAGNSSAEASALARQTAARAWASAKDRAAEAGSKWRDAAAAADRQAQHWRQVAELAAQQATPNWEVISRSATATAARWSAERQAAAKQAAAWTSDYEAAWAAEQRMADPPAPAAAAVPAG